MNIAVVGGHACSKKMYSIAQEAGRLIAREGWVLICGGGPGIMEAACRGAKEAGGLTVGILPGFDAGEANAFLDVRLTTGLGYARNILVVRAADAIIAISGEYGTLSEIAFAFSAEGGPTHIKNSGGGNDPKPIVGIHTWKIRGLKQVNSAKAALSYIKAVLKRRKKADA
jgi:hypothetical protein